MLKLTVTLQMNNILISHGTFQTLPLLLLNVTPRVRLLQSVHSLTRGKKAHNKLQTLKYPYLMGAKSICVDKKWTC